MVHDAFEVELGRQARKYRDRLNENDRRRVDVRLRDIAEDPYSSSIPLAGFEQLRRVRVGRIRIIFRIDTTRRRIEVGHIGPRGDIYKDL